ncbi:MAG: CocE/NonD family hydrolase [Gemmatimonadetes bacterium]|nr:CocE/NonD family hydrolase [Gemmatimonadota bacterium]MDE0064030.1 CocE/NonD family hydrolase [Gammaproteobacteria bacterium]MDE0364300.1 CocE/NonD family hydrolase [Gammaproteobacteria bacterium]
MKSTINVYEGYSEEVANGYSRSSVHVPVDDGCRIAVDILQPTLDGEPLDGPRPTVVQATGYRRAYYKKENEFNAPKYAKLTAHLPVGALITAYEQRPACRQVIHHGYNVVSIDFRGTGASFGAHANQTWRNAADIAQVVDWIAQQEWATDKVGMIGGSWEGVIQLATAVFQPRHLACIVPQIPPSIMNAIVDGGLAMTGFARDWSEMRKGQDGADVAAPVDGPDGERLFAEALAGRAPAYAGSDDLSVLEHMTSDWYVASMSEGAPPPPFPELGPLRDVFDEFERISRSGAAVYLQTGWWDMTFPGECLDLYEALDGPKRIIVGPWNHGVLPAMEPLRWFDYWLKGIDNGIADEPGVIFATTDLGGRAVWKAAESWPLPEVESESWFLNDTPSGTLSSVLDGSLERNAGPETTAEYPVDYGTGLGNLGRMRFMLHDEYIRHPHLHDRALRCATFTGPRFTEEVEITGSPALFLELATTASDGAIHVTLEQVMPNGNAEYVTEGWLNLRHRKVSESPRPHAGPAWHSQAEQDLLEVVPGERMTAALELYPVSVSIGAGSRLRLTVAGTDRDNLYVPERDPAPVLTLFFGGPSGSRLELPVEDVARRPEGRVIPDAFEGQAPGFAFAK